MRSAVPLLVAALVSAGAPALAGSISVPSGLEVTLQEIREDTVMGELWLRFRFVAPRIGKTVGKVTHDVALHDIDWLCENEAAPWALESGLEPARIVVSMADRDMEFGAADPEATQFFGAYRMEDGLCIWEEF